MCNINLGAEKPDIL